MTTGGPLTEGRNTSSDEEAHRSEFGRRLWRRLIDPVHLSIPVLIIGFCAIRRFGLIANIPYWLVAGLLISTWVISSINVALWGDATTGWQVSARMAVEMACVGIVIYGLGWGPVLAIGFVFGAADGMRSGGSAVAKPAMVCTVVCIALGQLAIGVGLAPSLLVQPLVHGLGALVALGAVMTIKVLEWFASARESGELRFRTLVQHASDIIIVTDPVGRLLYVSPSFERLLGRSARSFNDRSAREIIHAGDLANLRDVSADDPSADQERRGEIRLRTAAGDWKWFEATVTNHLDDPSVGGIVANLHDISERKQAEEELQKAHELFRSAFEHAPIGMAMSDLSSRILGANPAYARIVGRQLDELMGMNVSELTHPDDRHATEVNVRRLVRGECENFQLEKRYLRPDGQEVWGSVNVSGVRDEAGAPLYLIAQVEDVTERRALRERLAHAAIHDPLTDLPNRVLFMDRLEAALKRTSRNGRRTAVIFVDLDRFKIVNDSMGHAEGDKVLKAVSDRFRKVIRPWDTVARFGGDEFVVLFEDIEDDRTALRATNRLAKVLEDPIELTEGPVHVTASFGVALSHGHEDIAEDLLRDADAAMYRAKEGGRSQIQIFDRSDRPSLIDGLQLRHELHEAVVHDQFRLYYQPIVGVTSGQLVAVEALVRWQHPQRGLLLPGEFLSVMEESGLIISLGRWVLEEACRQRAAWEPDGRRLGSKVGPLRVNINLSPRQLVEPGFVELVEEVMSTCRIPFDWINLEITEGALATDIEATVRALTELRELGCHLSVDDFGAGFASLGYLSSFPVETLKIDRRFTSGLGIRAEDETIVESVIVLARKLGLTCIAEGVETEDQLHRLQAFQCDQAQGFLLGVPLPASSLSEPLTSGLRSWNGKAWSLWPSKAPSASG